MIDDQWHSVDEIVAYLDIKSPIAYNWVEERKMPAHKVGRLWKFKRKFATCLKSEIWLGRSDESAHEIEKQKDALIDEIEARMSQKVKEEQLFTVRWKLI